MSGEVNGGRGPGSGVRDPDRLLEEVDRELRAVLSNTPSAEFEARVRQRIDERPARRWMWKPSYAWLSAAAAVVVVAGAMVLLDRETPVTPVRPVAPAPAPEPLPAVNRLTPVREAASAAPALVPRRTVPVRVPTAGREPEVLVPPQQAEAIRRLATVGIEAAAQPVQTIAGVPEPLEVQPLVVEPIPMPRTQPSGGGTNPGDRGR